MKKKSIRQAFFDDYTIAKLLNDNSKLAELMNQDIYIWENVLLTELPVINHLLDLGLEEYEEGIYAGVVLGNLYEFDFIDKYVTISINLTDTYVFMSIQKRVLFISDRYKGSYIYANYDTMEIIKYIGSEDNYELVFANFNVKGALDKILACCLINSLDDLFNY